MSIETTAWQMKGNQVHKQYQHVGTTVAKRPEYQAVGNSGTGERGGIKVLKRVKNTRRKIQIWGTALAISATVLTVVTYPVSAGASKHRVITIAGMPYDLTDQFFVAMQCGALAATKAAGDNLQWEAPSGSSTLASAASLLSSFSSTKVGGIFLEGALSQTGLSRQISKIMKSGIPVTLVDNQIVPEVGYQTFESNNTASGVVLATAVNKLLGGSGDVGIISSYPTEGSESQRATGFEDALKAYPNIDMSSLQYAHGDTAMAATVAAAMIAGNPALKVIYTTDGPMGEGAASAIAAAHSSVKLISFDATPQEIQGVINGSITGLMAQSPYLMAYDAVKAMLKYDAKGIKGRVKPIAGSKQNVDTPFLFINQANVNTPSVKAEFEYPNNCKNI